MNVETQIRDARPEDAPAILELWNLAYRRPTGEAKAEISRLLVSPSARLLITGAYGVPDATLIVSFDGWRGNMYRLAVRPEKQRRGLARALVEEAHRWLRTLGCRRITALVEADSTRAASFWQAAGYTLDEAMSRYYLNLD